MFHLFVVSSSSNQNRGPPFLQRAKEMYERDDARRKSCDLSLEAK